MRFAIILALVLQFACGGAYAQGIPFPGPGGVAGILPPVSIGTRNISGITSNCNITTTAAVLAGDLLVALVMVASSPLRTVSTVSDGTNSYSSAVAQTDAGAYDNEIWYNGNASAVGSGATLSITLSGATNNNGCVAYAYRIPGMAAASTLDQTASQFSATSTPSVTTGTLAQARELAIAMAQCICNPATTTFTESAGFTTLVNNFSWGNGNGKVSVSYSIKNATTAVTYAPTWNSSLGAITTLATFKGGP